jgi:protein SCO1/2
MAIRQWVMAAAVMLATVGCRGGASTAADQFAARPDARRFDIEGTVVAVDRASRQITLQHGEVKGFMDAMTMPFAVKEQWAFDAAAPGDSLRGVLVVDGARAWIEGVSVTRTNAPPPASGRKASWAPADPGTPVPDVTLVDQDGRPLRLAAWRGQPYVITFSYTRCPLEEFCPLMMQRFAAIEKAIAGEPSLGAARLLTVTLDPVHDTPARLREYGAKFATGRGPGDPFSRWRLATGKPDQVKSLAAFFGLDYYTETTGQVIHSLRTAVIDREGRVARVFESNTWKVDAVIEALRAAAPPTS